MSDTVTVRRDDLAEAANDLLNLADWMEEYDREDAAIERVETLATRLRSVANPDVVTRRSVWIVAVENEEALPDAWVFSSQDAAIGWLAEQFAAWVKENDPDDKVDALLNLEQFAGKPINLWGVILDAQNYYELTSFALHERMIDGGGNLPL